MMVRIGWQACSFALIVLAAASASGQTVTIDFGTATTSLPYTEDGFTVTSLSGGGIIDGGDGDGELVGGTNTVPIRWQISAPAPFNLDALDVEDFARTWRIEAPGGQMVDVIADGTIDFTGRPGWQGISSFEIVHDPAQANGFARIDNMIVTVPEPAALGGATLSMVALLSRHRRHR